MTRRPFLLRPWVLAGAAVIGLLAVFRPWTTRPIASAAKAEFNATTYVQGIWPRVLAEAEANAGQGETTTTETRARFISGTGTVTRVDTSSRVGLAHLRITGGREPLQIVLQIGPVVRGTAVRDAVDFIQFSDFANQSDFAAVANALNERVLQTVLAPVDPGTLADKTIAFVGAARPRTESGAAFLEVVPVVLRIGGGSR